MAAECCAYIGGERCQYSVNFACFRTVSVHRTNDWGGGVKVSVRNFVW